MECLVAALWRRRKTSSLWRSRASRWGFDILSVSDHIVVPTTIDSIYPYNETGEFVSSASGEYMEQLATVSYLAGITSTIKLLTSVMVLPHRSPVLTAKILATIDVLSNGRLIVGCGVGWMREEFEAIDAPPYEERGAVSNEYLAAFKELWTSDNPSFDGKYCSFSDITFAPKPVQQPHPPLWIGGESPPALRRAAQLGDAWYPIGSNPTFPVGTFDQLADYMGRVRTNAENAGRDPATLDFAYSVNWYSDEGAQDVDGERRLLTGDAAQVADDINRLEGMGINHLMLNFPGDTADDTLAGMDRFVNNVKPLLG